MSKLALKRIAENKRTRVSFLDLGNCDLTEVPEEIGELVWLEELSFASEFWNGEQWIQSQNTGKANNIQKLGKGFAPLNQLKILRLTKNYRLNDLNPLSNLSALQTLDVSCSQVSDLNPLSNLNALQTFYVYNTQVSDLSPLSNLSALQILDVRNNPVSDLSPLSNLSALRELIVFNTPVSDLSPLSNLNALQILDVYNTQVSYLSPLSKLLVKGLEIKTNNSFLLSTIRLLRQIAENKKTRDTFLDLGNYGLTEVPDEIGELVWLEELSFAGQWWNGEQWIESQNTGVANNIQKLGKGFVQLQQLKTLWLHGVWNKEFDLSDLSPLSNLIALQTLNVSNTQVSDLSPLSNLSALQRLDVSYTSISDLSPLTNLTALQQLNVSDTPITDLSPLTSLTALQQLNISDRRWCINKFM